jgi:hypothetical protein
LEALTFSHPSANSIDQRWVENTDGTISYEFKSEEDERRTLLSSHLMLLISIDTLFDYFQIEEETDLLKTNWEFWFQIWNESN